MECEKCGQRINEKMDSTELFIRIVQVVAIVLLGYIIIKILIGVALNG